MEKMEKKVASSVAGAPGVQTQEQIDLGKVDLGQMTRGQFVMFAEQIARFAPVMAQREKKIKEDCANAVLKTVKDAGLSINPEVLRGLLDGTGYLPFPSIEELGPTIEKLWVRCGQGELEFPLTKNGRNWGLRIRPKIKRSKLIEGKTLDQLERAEARVSAKEERILAEKAKIRMAKALALAKAQG